VNLWQGAAAAEGSQKKIKVCYTLFWTFKEKPWKRGCFKVPHQRTRGGSIGEKRNKIKKEEQSTTEE